MGRREQAKGRKAEFELSERLSAYGYSVTPGAALSFGGVPDVTGLPGIHIECKRAERLSMTAALQQADRDAQRFQDGLPAVFHRRNREEWRVTMRLSDWLTLYGASKLAGNRTEKGGGCLARDG